MDIFVWEYYFTEGEFLRYEKNYTLLKNNPNYKALNSNMAQQILKEVDGSFKSFFGLLKLAKQGKYAFKDCKLPHYLPKGGYTTFVIGFVRLNENKLKFPFSNSFEKNRKSVEITIPTILLEKRLRKFVSYQKQPPGSSQFSIFTKLNVFKGILIQTMQWLLIWVSIIL